MIYTRDIRSFEIKKKLKKAFPDATFRVWIEKYSMGESIHVNSSLICRERKETEWGGYVMIPTQASVENVRKIREILADYEMVDRDSAIGEILLGGNTYLLIGDLY